MRKFQSIYKIKIFLFMYMIFLLISGIAAILQYIPIVSIGIILKNLDVKLFLKNKSSSVTVYNYFVFMNLFYIL